MGFLVGFSPWILYWVLVGNASFRVAVLVALALSATAVLVQRARRQPWHSLEAGTVVVFGLLAILAFTVSDHFLERWLQPIGNAGIFLIALSGIVIGRPFVREYATASVDSDTARSDGFRVITLAMTWMWAAVFAAMTVVSLIPPIMQGQATIHDGASGLSIVCYWVIPFTLLGLAGTASSIFPPWFDKKSTAMDARQATQAPGPTVQQTDSAADTIDPELLLRAPTTSRHDEPFTVEIAGPAADRVDLTLSGTDLYGRTWRWSHASAPHKVGDEAIWGMHCEEPADRSDLFIPPAEPWQVRVEATAAGHRTTITCRREALAPGAIVTDVDVDGRPGLLATPATQSHGTVVCFGGSEGGVDSQRAMISTLASRGWTALAYSWLDEPPDTAPIAEIPLERFSTAIHWSARRAGRPVEAIGISRGAEGLAAAMTLEATLPVRSLVLLSPSSVSWQAVGQDGEIPDTSSWSWAKRPYPYADLPAGALMPQLIRNAWRLSRDMAHHQASDLSLRPAYSAGLDREIPRDAYLAAERIDCPILCVTGSDDALWPSARMATALLERRSHAEDRHIQFEGAGHLLRPGLYPSSPQVTGGIALGGRPAEHAAACLHLADHIIDFLSR
ncbi:acyl-CoA thioester hydrolase/BAAT C-terminal domain-containing protein [Jongsikchunia kroppenstedtii]|uniref:acyl-CoA thioester hydrolase/BAAT C-terminal domain-containing protein n=1 Tax=Jongsikchunia kroppenstedtii TaxID=1121721 RepID=UPI00038001D3|nr:acyl-CoA thioester hydrolase/BAAT C-terminal domain-containing protein [Jongsikchunia kroppenstedtii]